MISVRGDRNQSFFIQSLNVAFKWLPRFPSKLCELRQEVLFPKDRNFPSDNASHIRIEKVWRCQIRRVGRMRSDSQRILWAKILRHPGHMGFGIVCMNDETTPNGFRTQFKNWLQNMFDIVGLVKCFPFGNMSTTWNPKGFHMIVTIIFLAWIICFSLSGVIRHPATRWFRNLSINKTTAHQGWRNIATLSAQPNGGLSRVRLTSVPLLPVVLRSVCEGLNEDALRQSQ
jgi:hypothetical protein